jgi:hypothetical protein
MDQEVMTLGGVDFVALVTDGWSTNERLVYHLAKPTNLGSATEFLCGGRGQGRPRPADDDPRDLCARCNGTLNSMFEQRGPLGTPDAVDSPERAALRADLQAYQSQFVRTRPSSVAITGWAIEQLTDHAGQWWWLGRAGRRPDTAPNYVVRSEDCADATAAGDDGQYRVCVRWRAEHDEAGPAEVTSRWCSLFVLQPDHRGDPTWFSSTPRHEPLVDGLIDEAMRLWRRDLSRP